MLNRKDGYMRTFFHTFRYRHGQAGGVTTSIKWELPSGYSVKMCWLSSSAAEEFVQHNTAWKRSYTCSTYFLCPVWLKGGLGVLGLTVRWIPDSSVHKAYLVRITTECITDGVLLMTRKWNVTDDHWNIWLFVRKTSENHLKWFKMAVWGGLRPPSFFLSLPA